MEFLAMYINTARNPVEIGRQLAYILEGVSYWLLAQVSISQLAIEQRKLQSVNDVESCIQKSYSLISMLFLNLAIYYSLMTTKSHVSTVQIMHACPHDSDLKPGNLPLGFVISGIIFLKRSLLYSSGLLENSSMGLVFVSAGRKMEQNYLRVIFTNNN